MSKVVERIVVVGGGVAGWLSALFLHTFLGHRTKVSLVAPGASGRMSVGESTNGPFTGFLDELGVHKEVILRRCDGTIKIASEFLGWNQQGTGYDWVHEFQPGESIGGIPLFHYWHQRCLSGATTGTYQDSCFINSRLVREGLVPFATPTDAARFMYGYHFDGNLLADVLRERAEKRGVEAVDGRVRHVQMSREHVASLVLDDGRVVAGDLFVDASGFRRVVIGAVPGDASAYLPLRDVVPCDSAVHCSCAPEPGPLRPSTRATALSSGWCWDIPLQSRTSVGYVYSSAFMDRDEAMRELRCALNIRPTVELSHIRWESGYFRRPWVSNCVAVGVAAGFLEPLESLTTATLTAELKSLLVHFPNKSFNEASRARYNAAVVRQYESNRDFIALHYHSATRRDSDFWRSRSSTSWVPDRVLTFCREFRAQSPRDADGIYSLKGVVGMLASRGCIPEEPYPLLEYIGDRAAAGQLLNDIAQDRRQAKQRYMEHRAFIKALAGGDA